MTDQLKECHCANIRSGSRKLSQFYDTILAPAKIRLTQFTILRQLYYAKTPHPTVMNLAVLLDTDRTTLGRNLAVLKRHGLVFFELDRDDRRVRRIQLSHKGKVRFRLALPYWRKAQASFENTLEKRKIEDMYSALFAINRANFASLSGQ